MPSIVISTKQATCIIDAHLSGQRYMVGETYTIVDMALWGWARMVPFILGENAWGFPNLKRRDQRRPAAQAAAALKERHSFKAEMDDEARQHMFRHLAAPAS